MTGQRGRLWVNIETALDECHVYSKPGDRLVLGQRGRQLTGIEPTMGCNADPTLNRNLGVGLHHLYEVHRRQVLNACWPVPAMVLVVEGKHVEDIFELVSLVLSLNTSWIFMRTHEEDHYTDFL